MTTAAKYYYFEDFSVDQEFSAATHTPSEHEIIDFASRWDPQPFHTDKTAANASIFGGLTACSAHIFAIFSTTAQHYQNGMKLQAVASLGFDELTMHRPVYAGDTLRCFTVVESLRQSKSRPDCGVLVNHVRLVNQHNDTVFSVKAASLLQKRFASTVD